MKIRNSNKQLAEIINENGGWRDVFNFAAQDGDDTTCRLTVTDGLSIDQLAADYRNAKDYAERLQQEADAAKANAQDARAVYVVAAGSAVGLVLTIEGSVPELVITDWRDLQVGDVIWIGVSPCESDAPEGEYTIVGEEIERYRNGSLLLQPVSVMHGKKVVHPDLKVRGWRFISRPAKEATNA
jgi:hypothetical protein